MVRSRLLDLDCHLDLYLNNVDISGVSDFTDTEQNVAWLKYDLIHWRVLISGLPYKALSQMVNCCSNPFIENRIILMPIGQISKALLW